MSRDFIDKWLGLPKDYANMTDPQLHSAHISFSERGENEQEKLKNATLFLNAINEQLVEVCREKMKRYGRLDPLPEEEPKE